MCLIKHPQWFKLAPLRGKVKLMAQDPDWNQIPEGVVKLTQSLHGPSPILL